MRNPLAIIGLFYLTIVGCPVGGALLFSTLDWPKWLGGVTGFIAGLFLFGLWIRREYRAINSCQSARWTQFGRTWRVWPKTEPLSRSDSVKKHTPKYPKVFNGTGWTAAFLFEIFLIKSENQEQERKCPLIIIKNSYSGLLHWTIPLNCFINEDYGQTL